VRAGHKVDETKGAKRSFPRLPFDRGVFIRFSRYRFKEGQEAEGVEVLRRHVSSLQSADGCEEAWLAQGQHPSTEFIVVARFRDESSLRAFEGGLRSDPSRGSDLFSLLRLTTMPPEQTQYEVLRMG
jgi:heme-degrading monooxygenase HmoA